MAKDQDHSRLKKDRFDVVKKFRELQAAEKISQRTFSDKFGIKRSTLLVRIR